MAKVTIDKAECREDYDNMCLQPSDGGQYNPSDALRILENGNGGSMREVSGKGRGFMVSYDKSQNDWIRKELKL